MRIDTDSGLVAANNMQCRNRPIEHKCTVPTRVLIVDDHPLFREAVARLLSEYSEFEIVAEASDGEEALALAASVKPRIVILDIGLPKINGIEITRHIKQHYPKIAIVILSVHNDVQHVNALLRAGADAYLTKDVAKGEIVHALREVNAGRLFVCQSALHHVITSLAMDRKGSSFNSEQELTPREREILQLLAQGLSNREIADQLSLSTATVKGHIESIYSKLKVNSRTEAVTSALRLGILQLSDI